MENEKTDIKELRQKNNHPTKILMVFLQKDKWKNLCNKRYILIRRVKRHFKISCLK